MNVIRFQDITILSVDDMPAKGKYVYRNGDEPDVHVLRIRTADTTAVMYVLLAPEIRITAGRRKELLRAVRELTGDDPKQFESCVEREYGGLWSIRIALIYHRATDLNVIYRMFETLYEDES